MTLSRTRLLAVLTLVLPVGAQTTWHVDANAPGPGTGTVIDPFASIQFAIDSATTVTGDTLSVAPGIYVEDLSFGIKGLNVASTDGALDTVLMAASPTSVVVLFGGYPTTVEGFTIQGIGQQTIGVRSEWGNQGSLRRCIIRDHEFGAHNHYDMFFTHCNLIENLNGLGHYGGGHGPDALTYLTNTILWDNTSNIVGSDISPFSFSLSLTNCTTTEDPLFFGPGDYHLQLASPCINAGSNQFLPNDPNGTLPDIGVLPYDFNYPIGESYCSATENSTGNVPSILVTGSTSVAASDLVFLAVRCPYNAAGIFFYGTSEVYLPWGNGFRCVGGAIARLPLAPTSATGVATFALDLNALPTHVPAIMAGSSRPFQYWYRDTPAGGAGFNYTNAVQLEFTP